MQHSCRNDGLARQAENAKDEYDQMPIFARKRQSGHSKKRHCSSVPTPSPHSHPNWCLTNAENPSNCAPLDRTGLI
jgi:hypothetical protein